jgi:thiol-disulfide isomerase/thioredoxin
LPVFEVPTIRQLLLTLVVALSAAACGSAEPRRLAQGSPAPDFTLPGVDGKPHSLREYADSRLLAVVFTCNTCPASQLYESRIRKLRDDYRGKGVMVVAINPNKPGAMQLADLGHSDVGESLEDMKARAAYRRIDYPYLSDGETQAVSRQFQVVTLPHIFVFDAARTLQYDGRIDDSPQETLVKAHDARNAIDALLAGRPVAVNRTTVTGCPVKGLSGPAGPDAQRESIDKAPVAVETADADALKRLRQNGTGKLLLVNFWATWCAPCASEFPDLEATYRMYKARNLEFATVSVNDPEERAAVLEFLKAHKASHRNLQFASSDVYALQAAFDPKLPAPVPFTLLLAPNGDVLYQELGELDVTKLRRAILANLPDDAESAGLQAYWSATDQQAR